MISSRLESSCKPKGLEIRLRLPCKLDQAPNILLSGWGSEVLFCDWTRVKAMFDGKVRTAEGAALKRTVLS